MFDYQRVLRYLAFNFQYFFEPNLHRQWEPDRTNCRPNMSFFSENHRVCDQNMGQILFWIHHLIHMYYLYMYHPIRWYLIVFIHYIDYIYIYIFICMYIYMFIYIYIIIHTYATHGTFYCKAGFSRPQNIRSDHPSTARPERSFYGAGGRRVAFTVQEWGNWSVNHNGIS